MPPRPLDGEASTDRRKMQNRQAARLYRQRRNQRLTELQAHYNSTTGTVQPNILETVDPPSLSQVSTASEHDHIARMQVSFTPYRATSQLTFRRHHNDHMSLMTFAMDNCLALGFNLREALDPLYQSPFPQGKVDCVKLGRLPADLVPTCAQYRVTHPAWLDAVPVPAFRDAVLAQADEFDKADAHNDLRALKADLVAGVTCWGWTVESRPDMVKGDPADQRNWEAHTWFLTKWARVTGGLHGDWGRSSGWWRTLRGPAAKRNTH